MSSWSWKAGLAGIAMVAATAYAVAQMSDHARMHGQISPGGAGHQMIPPDGIHDQMMQGRHGMIAESETSAQPTMPGQAAFGTIQEIVRMLEADRTTDWSKVNISALRDHLVDMDEVTMRAAATERSIDNGVDITVTGEGRTLQAIKRMVPAHVRELTRLGWNAKAEELPNGVRMTVTGTDAQQATKLRALGFMGIMVQGSHHQQHHLMMAKGEFSH